MPLSVLWVNDLPAWKFARNDRPLISVFLMVFKYESFLFVSDRSFGYSLGQMIMPSTLNYLTFLSTTLLTACEFKTEFSYA